MNMKKAFALLLLLLGSVNVSAKTINTETYQFESKKNGHATKIIFYVRPFMPAQHRILKQNSCPIIDGRKSLGTDCSLPHREIVTIEFYFDGKQMSVPRRLYADCFEPPFHQKNIADGSIKDYFAIRIGDDLQSAFVFMSGSDAAGSYQVLWVLRKDGRHARFSGACPDCGFIDFQSEFFHDH